MDNKNCYYDYRPLYTSVRKNNFEMFEFLLQRGASLEDGIFYGVRTEKMLDAILSKGIKPKAEHINRFF